MKLKVLLTTITAALTLHAQTTQSLPKHCDVDPSLETTEFIPIPGQPNFFFRAFPQARLISYASESGNYILDMDSKKRFSLPGEYDPVPMGENVITVPNYNEGLSFYSVKEIMNGVSDPEPLLVANELKGVYQSIGLVAKGKKQETYAVILAGDDGTLYQEFHVEGLNVTPNGPVQKLCPGVDIKLPMLSKNGKEVSGIDGEAGISKIWKLDINQGTCEEVENLGIAAGKADFSFDGRELIFHMRGDGLSSSSYFSVTSQEMNMNVYAYNRDKKTIYPVTQSRPGDNSYFPVYRQDGSIVYAAVGASGVAQFAKVHPKDVKTKALNFFEISKSEKLKTLLTLGHIWNLSCTASNSSGQTSVEALLAAAFSLHTKQCQSMVQTSYSPDMLTRMRASNPMKSTNKLINYDAQQTQEFTSAELLKACEDM